MTREEVAQLRRDAESLHAALVQSEADPGWLELPLERRRADNQAVHDAFRRFQDAQAELGELV